MLTPVAFSELVPPTLEQAYLTIEHMRLQEVRDQTRFQIRSYHVEIAEKLCKDSVVPALELGRTYWAHEMKELARRTRPVFERAYASRTERDGGGEDSKKAEESVRRLGTLAGLVRAGKRNEGRPKKMCGLRTL